MSPSGGSLTQWAEHLDLIATKTHMDYLDKLGASAWKNCGRTRRSVLWFQEKRRSRDNDSSTQYAQVR